MLEYPNEIPICCGRKMYAAGGTLGPITPDSVRYWKCEICNNEIVDIPNECSLRKDDITIILDK